MEKGGLFLKESCKGIVQRYEERLSPLPELYKELQKKFSGIEPETVLALKYLYAHMPYSDMGNYPFETYLDYGEHAVLLWKEYEDMRSLPEEIFLNYVLYHRVNEEEIAPCRSFFFGEMEERLQGLHGKEAAVEVNYWCAQEASYRCTDDRTLSAIAVYRRGSGRCGEESVFTVNALRSAGIPARQVYAPKWSHCDDNHAWVEVWCEGVWHFMGACEPCPVLNKGWFTGAASRAMMVHSRWFDSKKPEAEVIGTDGMVTMLNELGRYARTKRIKVRVQEEAGRPVKGAEVSFEVLNYSEYAPIARKMTDDSEEAELITGLGSLHIHVRKGDDFAEEVLDTRREDICHIIMKTPDITSCWRAYDMTAPEDGTISADLPVKEQEDKGEERLASAVQKLRGKTADWKHQEREDFLNGKDAPELRKAMLEALTEKDQTDCLRQVLEEHLEYAMPCEKEFPREIFVPYVLNPRVDNEVLSKYRKIIHSTFSNDLLADMRKNPKKIWSIIEERIQSLPEEEHSSLITTPAACLKLGIGSMRSKEILFVAAARTLGIPARKNPEDGSIEYWENDSFIPVHACAQKTCRLLLRATGNIAWKYFQNWSIARLSKGRYHTLNLSDCQWKNQKLELTLSEGRYRILTANRLPNGNIFANQYELRLKSGEQKETELKMRKADLSDMLTNITLPDFSLKNTDGTTHTTAKLLEKGKHILLFLEEGKEPTEHILNEILEQKETFAQYTKNIILITKTPESLKDPTLSRTLKALPEIKTYYDESEKNINMLGRKLYVDHEKLPLIIITNKKTAIYATSGYNVGIAGILLQFLRYQD